MDAQENYIDYKFREIIRYLLGLEIYLSEENA